MRTLNPSVRRRDWKRYNKALVSRAEIFLDTKVLRNWNRELKGMNCQKQGRRFIFPKCFIKYLALLRVYLQFSFRALESVVGFLQRYMPHLKEIDHSTIHRRTNDLESNVYSSVKHRRGLVVSIDSSGLKVHNRGEWIRHKHKVRRGYLKIHFAVNTKTREVVALDTTKEEVGDNLRFRPMVRRMLRHYTLKKALADAAYDDHRNFNLLDKHKIIPAIKLKRNSRRFRWWPKFDRKHRVRRKFALLMRNHFREWHRRAGYGRRWISEVVFSCFKANFGEYFSAKKMENIRKEIEWKVYAHNLIVNHLAKC